MKKFILVNRETDCTMYAVAGTMETAMRPTVTDNINDATVFDERDNMVVKARFYSNILGITVVAEEM